MRHRAPRDVNQTASSPAATSSADVTPPKAVDLPAANERRPPGPAVHTVPSRVIATDRTSASSFTVRTSWANSPTRKVCAQSTQGISHKTARIALFRFRRALDQIERVLDQDFAGHL